MTTPYQALADPTRRQILDLLRERPRLVGDLVEIIGISQPGVSKQLRVLRDAGLVRVRQDAQRRWYELNAEPLAEVHAWLDAYKRAWEDRLERLDSYLQDLQSRDTDHE